MHIKTHIVIKTYASLLKGMFSPWTQIVLWNIIFKLDFNFNLCVDLKKTIKYLSTHTPNVCENAPFLVPFMALLEHMH